MCELFGLSASAPARVRYDLNRFAAEGGERHQNRDGWGIVLHEGPDAHWFREADAASKSALDRFVSTHAAPHSSVIAHVRRASQGARGLQNTHPFRRTLMGRPQHFAHNGTLHGIAQLPEARALAQHAIGETDSELAFLILLNRLSRQAPASNDIAARFHVFDTFCRDMAALGPANFLWLDGDTLFAHADRRQHETPQGLTPPQPPGLCLLDLSPDPMTAHDCAGVTLEDLPERTILLASVPLSDADWAPLPQGTALALSGGRVICREPKAPDAGSTSQARKTGPSRPA